VVAPDTPDPDRALRSPAVLLTGHPSSGKSTLAAALRQALGGRGVAGEILDGDELRDRLPPRLGFAPEDRRHQFARGLFLAELLSAHRVLPILALVAPYGSDRDLGRRRFAAAGWVEVFLDPPRETCIDRDTRGVYRRLDAAGGRAAVDAGVFDLYEPPPAPTLRLDTSGQDVGQSVDAVLDVLLPLLRPGR
jgi:adenylylsulfate kinase